ncbi:MAG: EpsI family protein [Planctomycetota bacterium]|nr:EpsI family protein [Planctomycetota bacterium]
MTRILPIAIACGLIGVVTYLQGTWTQRWSTAPEEDMKQMAERYQTIPLEVGDWQGEDLPSSERELQRAGGKASISRKYTNRQTGEVVSVFVILGYSRDVAVHTPDACYVGRGYQMERRPIVSRVTSEGSTATMKTSTFLKEQGEAAIHQRIFWAWTHDGQWEAPQSPRWKYGGRTILNKVYLISNIPAGQLQAAEESPAHRFGQLFLNSVGQVLYPSVAVGNSKSNPTRS